MFISTFFYDILEYECWTGGQGTCHFGWFGPFKNQYLINPSKTRRFLCLKMLNLIQCTECKKKLFTKIKHIFIKVAGTRNHVYIEKRPYPLMNVAKFGNICLNSFFKIQKSWRCIRMENRIDVSNQFRLLLAGH